MTKPNKKAIAEKLDAWAKNERKRLRAEADRDLELEPHVTRFQKAVGPVNAAAEEKLRPLNEAKKQFEAEIMSMLEAGIDRETGTVALPQVEVERAIARVDSTEGNRVIDPKDFFDYTVAANRNDNFWDCVTIPIGKATKFLGSAIERLAKKPTKFEVKIILKD
jgi:hypothetical protein